MFFDESLWYHRMMERKFDVYGIGNAIIDLQLRVSEDDIKSLRLEKAAMKLVESSEQDDLLRYFSGRELNKASGGSAANTMIGIAQLGGTVSYGCLVGGDGFGSFYLEEMRKLGVALHTTPRSGEVTGTSVILITPDAERTMNTHLGASSLFDEVDVSERMLAESSWLYIEGYLFSSPGGQRAVQRAIELAREYDVKVAITFSDGFIVDVFGEPLRNAVDQADLIFANLNESRRFTGGEDEEEVFAKLKEVVPSCVMTMSERGAIVFYDGKESKIDPFPVTAVDDTGAGDMFAGAFLFGITHGMNGAAAGKLACFLSSRVVSQLGPRLKSDARQIARDHGLLK